MQKEYWYRIADFPFALHLPAEVETNRLLPSFRPFAAEKPVAGKPLFDFLTLPRPRTAAPHGSGCLLDELQNDMGHIRLYTDPEGYRVEISSGICPITHSMQVSPAFDSAKAAIFWEDPQAGLMLSSLLRIVYAQALLRQASVSIHASAVYRQGKAYLFMGKSGTGKSTHAALWLRHLPDTRLLNDDNPVIRLKDGDAIAYGSPWSGKTPCYKNLAFPVGGMVRLYQASVNRFTVQKNVDAFITLYPGCSVISNNALLSDGLFDTLAQLAEKVPVGIMECLPNKEAALLCCHELKHNTMNKTQIQTI